MPSTATQSAGLLADGIDASLLGSTTQMPQDLSWSVWSPDFTGPTVSQWNLSVQRQVGSSWMMTTSYVGSRSRHLQRVYNMNAAGPGDGRTERARRMIPSLGAIMMIDSAASARYDGLQTTLDKRPSGGWQGSLAYTWSHSIDNAAEPAGAEGMLVVQNWRDPDGSRGNSGFDRRHRLVANAVWDLPFGAGRRWLQDGGALAAVFGGWQVSGIVSAQSGAWFDVTILDPTNRLGVTPGSNAWRPDLVGDPTVPHPTADAWLNPAAFAIPQNGDGTYRYGDLGRNTLLGPGYFNVDAALTKDIGLGGSRRLQIRWEVFNLTNHPSFSLPNAELGSADFGTIRSTVSTPRQMQFGVKFLF